MKSTKNRRHGHKLVSVFCLLLVPCFFSCEDGGIHDVGSDPYIMLSEIDTVITVIVHPEDDIDFNNIYYQETYPLSPAQHRIDAVSSFSVFEIDIDTLYNITLSAISSFSDEEAFFFLTFYNEAVQGFEFLRIHPGHTLAFHGSWAGEAVQTFGFFGYSESSIPADSIWLSLIINNDAYLEDSLFIMEPIHLQNVQTIPFPQPSVFPDNSLLSLRLWNDTGNEDVHRYHEIVEATDLRPFYYTTADSPHNVSRKFHQFSRGSVGGGWWDYNEWEGYNIVAHSFWLRLPAALIGE